MTLLTCTPYGVNSHRLLVRGHRVAYEPKTIEEEEQTPLASISLHTNYLFWAAAGLAATAAAIVLLAFLDRQRRKKAEDRGAKEQT